MLWERFGQLSIFENFSQGSGDGLSICMPDINSIIDNVQWPPLTGNSATGDMN